MPPHSPSLTIPNSPFPAKGRLLFSYDGEAFHLGDWVVLKSDMKRDWVACIADFLPPNNVNTSNLDSSNQSTNTLISSDENNNSLILSSGYICSQWAWHVEELKHYILPNLDTDLYSQYEIIPCSDKEYNPVESIKRRIEVVHYSQFKKLKRLPATPKSWPPTTLFWRQTYDEKTGLTPPLDNEIVGILNKEIFAETELNNVISQNESLQSDPTILSNLISSLLNKYPIESLIPSPYKIALLPRNPDKIYFNCLKCNYSYHPVIISLMDTFIKNNHVSALPLVILENKRFPAKPDKEIICPKCALLTQNQLSLENSVSNTSSSTINQSSLSISSSLDSSSQHSLLIPSNIISDSSHLNSISSSVSNSKILPIKDENKKKKDKKIKISTENSSVSSSISLASEEFLSNFGSADPINTSSKVSSEKFPTILKPTEKSKKNLKLNKNIEVTNQNIQYSTINQNKSIINTPPDKSVNEKNTNIHVVKKQPSISNNNDPDNYENKYSTLSQSSHTSSTNSSSTNTISINLHTQSQKCSTPAIFSSSVASSNENKTSFNSTPKTNLPQQLLLKLQKAFEKGLDEVSQSNLPVVHKDPSRLAFLVFETIMISFSDVKEKRQRFHEISENLRRENNADLRRKVLTGEIDIQKLVMMDTQNLAPEAVQREREQQRKRYFDSEVTLRETDLPLIVKKVGEIKGNNQTDDQIEINTNRNLNFENNLNSNSFVKNLEKAKFKNSQIKKKRSNISSKISSSSDDSNNSIYNSSKLRPQPPSSVSSSSTSSSISSSSDASENSSSSDDDTEDLSSNSDKEQNNIKKKVSTSNENKRKRQLKNNQKISSFSNLLAGSKPPKPLSKKGSIESHLTDRSLTSSTIPIISSDSLSHIDKHKKLGNPLLNNIDLPPENDVESVTIPPYNLPSKGRYSFDNVCSRLHGIINQSPSTFQPAFNIFLNVAITRIEELKLTLNKQKKKTY